MAPIRKLTTLTIINADEPGGAYIGEQIHRTGNCPADGRPEPASHCRHQQFTENADLGEHADRLPAKPVQGPEAAAPGWLDPT